MPFFCRHSRIAGNLGLPVRGPLPWVDEPLVDAEVPAVLVALVAAALVCEVVLPEEPPHAVKPRLVSVRTARTLAAGWRKAFLMMGIELLFR
jgi:hypothetical protein